jgi:bacterioferritin-associated ferredoxin
VIVCHCLAVRDSTIRELVDAGLADVDAIAAACRAGTDCGKCRVVVETIIESETHVSLARAS